MIDEASGKQSLLLMGRYSERYVPGPADTDIEGTSEQLAPAPLCFDLSH